MYPLDYEELFRPNEIEFYNKTICSSGRTVNPNISAKDQYVVRRNFKLQNYITDLLQAYKEDSFLYNTYQILINYKDFKYEFLLNVLLGLLFLISSIFNSLY